MELYSGLKKGGKFEKLGLKKGDVIKTVNGTTVSSPSEAMELYSGLKEGEEIQVERKE